MKGNHLQPASTLNQVARSYGCVGLSQTLLPTIFGDRLRFKQRSFGALSRSETLDRRASVFALSR